ncbi:unnamed protein product [Effrenium voratum]|uniref:Uncharacterized protein n=1 Tax=Effrenium voratum TaxID=2562239 RepID=A0AA36JFL8_9DINO|nr:unnamed protein product [Effrenium voratum]CAJ1446540.1 unnamed protein product [Effrenium voratum]
MPGARAPGLRLPSLRPHAGHAGRCGGFGAARPAASCPEAKTPWLQRLPLLCGPFWRATSFGRQELGENATKVRCLGAEEQADLAAQLRIETGRKELLGQLSKGLEDNRREALADGFAAQGLLEQQKAQAKAELLAKHRELKFKISAKEFLQLKEVWQRFIQAEQDVERHHDEKADSQRSASTWTAVQLAGYVPCFHLRPWQPSAGWERRVVPMEDLREFLQEPAEVDAEPSLLGSRLGEDWQEKYLQNLGSILQVMGCQVSHTSQEEDWAVGKEVQDKEVQQLLASSGQERREKLMELFSQGATHHLVFPALGKAERHQLHVCAGQLKKVGWTVQTHTDRGKDGERLHMWVQKDSAKDGSPGVTGSREEVFGRLRGLDELPNGKEAAVRTVVDALIFPLCAELKTQVSMEEGFKSEPFPTSVCDYTFRSDQKVLGALEAKRCLPNWAATLSQGAAQCLWQLASMRATQECADPCVGLVTNGRRWVCLELHGRHLSISKTLDISKEANFWVLLDTLTRHLEAR